MRACSPLVREQVLEVNHRHRWVRYKAVSISSHTEQTDRLITLICEGASNSQALVMAHIVVGQRHQPLPRCNDNGMRPCALWKVVILQVLQCIDVCYVQQSDLQQPAG